MLAFSNLLLKRVTHAGIFQRGVRGPCVTAASRPGVLFLRVLMQIASNSFAVSVRRAAEWILTKFDTAETFLKFVGVLVF